MFTETVGSPLCIYSAQSRFAEEMWHREKRRKRYICAKVNAFENIEIRVSVLERITVCG